MSGRLSALAPALLVLATAPSLVRATDTPAGDTLHAYLPGGALMQFRWIPPGIGTIGTDDTQADQLRLLGLVRARTEYEQPTR